MSYHASTQNGARPPGIYDAGVYPEGVPNPFVPNILPYPSQQHGGDWTRPVFDMPWVDRPHVTLGPPGNVYSNRRLGIGQTEGVMPMSPFKMAALGAVMIGAGTVLLGSSKWFVPHDVERARGQIGGAVEREMTGVGFAAGLVAFPAIWILAAIAARRRA